MPSAAIYFQHGLRSAQPAATAVNIGTLYFVTDENLTERSDGTVWETFSDAGSIANDTVTNAKLANMATTTIKGRTTAGTGDPEDLTASQARTVLGLNTTDAPQFGRMGIGTAADANSKLKIGGDYWSPTVAAGSSGTSKTLDWRDGNTQLLTLTGNCTLTLSNPQDGARYLICLKQDGTGSRTVTWPSSVKWPAGAAPTLTTGAGLVDVIALVWFASLGASGNYIAAATQNFTPA